VCYITKLREILAYNFTVVNNVLEIQGSSIKGLVKRKNTSPLKKLYFFLGSKLFTST